MYSGLRIKTGSGKSTLINFIIKALGVPKYQVAYVAYTGKAAAVLQAKGNPNATTVHRLLYRAEPRSNGTFYFRPRHKGEIKYRVIVVDEVSMLPKNMWDQLLSHGIYVIAAGDPGQLPPIDKNANNHVLDNPHVFLDEIMRQAQDSEIIRLSMHVRQGKPIATFPCSNEQVKILHRKDLSEGLYKWPDQIICATNDTRTFINNLVRVYKGFDPEKPCVGDKIIGLHNDWGTASDSGNWMLTNGTIGEIINYEVRPLEFPVSTGVPVRQMDVAWTDFSLEDGDQFTYIPIDYEGLRTGEMTLDNVMKFRLNKSKFPLIPHDFVYAYAITCWKAQGSEYDNVLLIEEGHPFNKEEHMKYLYTGITRAKEKLVVVVKD